MANMTTGSSLANGNKRTNEAKDGVDARFNSAFSAGQGMANARQNPMHSNSSSTKNTSNDGTRV